jgi:RNA polymerase sigma-70 factor (ECF subfamily)
MAVPPLPADDDRPGRAALEDEWLAVRCQLGERDAFDELIARWHVPLWRFIRRLIGSDDAAAECTQEVWLRVCRGIVRLRDASRFRAWMFGIARRVVVDRLREHYAEARVDDVDVDELPSATEDADLKARVADLHQELARLPVIEREVLVLFYLEELSLADLAGILEVPVGTVKSRLYRARRLLGAELARKGYA